MAAARPPLHIAAIFGPEHGFRGTAQAGGAEGFFRDPKTGRPVYDTYLKGPAAMRPLFAKAGVGE